MPTCPPPLSVPPSLYSVFKNFKRVLSNVITPLAPALYVGGGLGLRVFCVYNASKRYKHALEENLRLLGGFFLYANGFEFIRQINGTHDEVVPLYHPSGAQCMRPLQTNSSAYAR
jgi:hypothetical protein